MAWPDTANTTKAVTTIESDIVLPAFLYPCSYEMQSNT